MDGSWNPTQADASKIFTDYAEISEHQSGLVQLAYRDSLLDSGTDTLFRPKDKLTHAEAISLLYKVTKKTRTEAVLASIPENHWAAAELRLLLEQHSFTSEQLENIRLGLAEDDVVPAVLWHELLMSVLGKPTDLDSLDADYTYRLAEGEFMPRDRAVAGLMKLWGPSRDALKPERTAAAKAFSDYEDAFDPSKLAIAYSIGVIQGYGSRFGPERGLSYSEALVLLSRIVQLGVPK